MIQINEHKDIFYFDLIIFYISFHEQTDDDEALLWQKSLYKKIGSKKDASKTDLDCMVERVLAMSKVLHGLHLVRSWQRWANSCPLYGLRSGFNVI